MEWWLIVIFENILYEWKEGKGARKILHSYRLDIYSFFKFSRLYSTRSSLINEKIMHQGVISGNVLNMTKRNGKGWENKSYRDCLDIYSGLKFTTLYGTSRSSIIERFKYCDVIGGNCVKMWLSGKERGENINCTAIIWIFTLPLNRSWWCTFIILVCLLFVLASQFIFWK